VHEYFQKYKCTSSFTVHVLIELRKVFMSKKCLLSLSVVIHCWSTDLYDGTSGYFRECLHFVHCVLI